MKIQPKALLPCIPGFERGMLMRLKKMLNSKGIVNIMYIPVILLFVSFIIYPLIKGIGISMTNWNGYSDASTYIGLENYRKMFADRNFFLIIKNTLIYGIGSAVLENVVGLLYAVLLDKKSKAVGFARTAIYLPVIVAPLIMGYIWYFMFEPIGGAVNDILIAMGLESVDLLTKGTTTVWIITFINSYQYVGIAMMIYLAGLQTIPADYQEAAKIDGASSFQNFVYVKIPLLLPSITVNVVTNLIGSLKLFDIIVAMTNGGPGYSTQSLSTMMYQLYFGKQDAGYAAAMGIFMFCSIAVISVAVLLWFRKREVDA